MDQEPRAPLPPPPHTLLPPDLKGVAEPMHRAGDLEVRLARTEAEVLAAQALRYAIFYEEMGARASEERAAQRLDVDAYDPFCDHLLVVDHSAGPGGPQRVVGTYRLLLQRVAARHAGFYSADEFDLGPLLAGAGSGQQLLELGRSCVAADHRSAATINLLWRGIATYLGQHNVSHMFGCGSLHGTDPRGHVRELAYLHHHHLAPPELRARAHDGLRVETDALPRGSYDVRQAARALPPLIKGYLRVGAMIGDGAFIDRDFNTIDVFVIMPVERIADRYAGRFEVAGAGGGRAVGDGPEGADAGA
jgi:putative hemolysin